MKRRSTLLLSVLLVLGLLLPALAISAPVASGGPAAHSAAPAATLSVMTSNDKRPRKTAATKKRHGKKNAHRHKGNARSRKTHRGKSAPRHEDEAALDSAVNAASEKGLGDFCSGIRLPKSDECTHGPDPAPPGYDIDQPVPLLTTGAARARLASLVCEDDGQTGFRLQVLYVYGSTNRLNTFENSISGWVGEMNQIYQSSAEETGPTRSLRFVQDAASCEPAILPVQVTPSALNDFDTMIQQFKTKGLNRTDRIYLSFVDTTEYCGIATWQDDDRANGTINLNNHGPSYARVDRGCWGGDTASHEVMHNLGGVQNSAPHTTFDPNNPAIYAGGHCIDEWDIMCYSDVDPAHNLPPTIVVCPDQALDLSLLDCGHDDYYNTAPAPANYLATHWNPANNRFLIGAPAAPLPDDFTAPTVTWLAPVANNQIYEATSDTVALQATASDDKGVAYIEFWRYDNRRDDWRLISTDDTPPYTSSINLASLSIGDNDLSADAYDTAGNWDYEVITINRPQGGIVEPPPPQVDPASPPAQVDTAPSGNNNNKTPKHKKAKKGNKKRH
jgi:hypothetical protein